MSEHYAKTRSISHYLNWDRDKDREIILAGIDRVVEVCGLEFATKERPLIIFDELHKYSRWKTFLKGFYDTYKKRVQILVTGSSRLDIYRKGGDSLMGRYFSYRVHPLSVAELVHKKIPTKELFQPLPIDEKDFDVLVQFGGFPDPYLKRNPRFSNRWRSLRRQQLVYEDIRSMTQIQEISQVERLVFVLQEQASQLMNMTSLSKHLGTAVTTIKRWLNVLQAFYFCFMIQPWHKNITRSLLKEPKLYLWDWSEIKDIGARCENMVASHLLKAVHFWNDFGLGQYGLYFLRDLEKREIDFCVTKNGRVWFIVEVKNNAKARLSPHLAYYQKITGAKHAFQVAFDLEYIDIDCFSYNEPVIVSAKTFLAQLI